MSGLHGALGWLTVGAAVIVVLAAVVTWLTWERGVDRTLARLTDLVVAVVAVLVFAALFVGGLLLVTGVASRPDAPRPLRRRRAGGPAARDGRRYLA